MARGEVWNEVRTLFRFGRVKIAEARLFVAQDDTRPLPGAFQMLASLRILGAQLDNDNKTNNFPVKDGDMSVPIAAGDFNGSVDGTISNWHGTDPDGSASSGQWDKAEKVAYTLTALGKVTIPVADIIDLIPGIGTVLKAILKHLPGQHVTFTLGLVDVDVPVHRVDGKVVLPAGALVPQWWT